LSIAVPLACGACRAPDAPAGPSPGEPVAAPPPARADEALQTDSLAYTAVYRAGQAPYRLYGFRVVARFTNRTPAPVYLERCYPDSPTPIFDVQLVGDTAGAGPLGSVFRRLWGCVGHDRQIEVASGTTRTDTLDLVGPSAFEGGTGRPLGRFDGRLRLSYNVQACRGGAGCGLPVGAGLSNAFDVTVER
jgi:hypothetical protein